MPVYNCQMYIKDAIDSILRQTHANFELLIIDDCSTDNTLKSIKTYTDRRITLIEKKQKKGLVDSLNIGILTAKGEFIARMDGDDISLPNRFERQISFLKSNPEVSICGSSYQIIGSNKIIPLPLNPEEIKIALLEYCPMAHPTVMIKAKFLWQYNLIYDSDFETAEDYELWTRCAWLGRMANLPEPLLLYRLHNAQYSETKKAKQQTKSESIRANVLKKLWEEASIQNHYVQELLFLKGNISDFQQLNNYIKWVEHLLKLNQIKNIFEPEIFENFALNKNKIIIRTFFLTKIKYTPKNLYKVIKRYPLYKNYFSISEQAKFVIKCFIKPISTAHYRD
ncbi:glycosyltransferase family 2 protein [Pedobacter sp. MW01-1-1]